MAKKDPFQRARELLQEEPLPLNLIEQLEELREDVDPEVRPLFDDFFEAAEAAL
jgi:hypothetical protein